MDNVFSKYLYNNKIDYINKYNKYTYKIQLKKELEKRRKYPLVFQAPIELKTIPYLANLPLSWASMVAISDSGSAVFPAPSLSLDDLGLGAALSPFIESEILLRARSTSNTVT